MAAAGVKQMATVHGNGPFTMMAKSVVQSRVAALARGWLRPAP